MNLEHLGTPIGPMTRIHCGFANRLYRLDTDQGSFAVKELNLVDRRWTYRVDDVFRFEQAAFAAGIPMPEPVSASHDTLVHRWVDGDKVPEAPVSAAFAFEIGEILARIHALDVEWTHVSIEDPTPRDWPELAERAAARQASTASQQRRIEALHDDNNRLRAEVANLGQRLAIAYGELRASRAGAPTSSSAT